MLIYWRVHLKSTSLISYAVSFSIQAEDAEDRKVETQLKVSLKEAQLLGKSAAAAGWWEVPEVKWFFFAGKIIGKCGFHDCTCDLNGKKHPLNLGFSYFPTGKNR